MAEKRLIHEVDDGVAYRVILTNADGTTADPGASAANDREIVVTTYRVITTGTGYSAGDTVTASRVLDVDGATVTQVGTTIWYNETTAAAIASAPTAEHLSLAGAGALTDAQLALRLGAADDAAAASDTATATLMAFIKRSMANWTTLLGRIPGSNSTRIPTEPLGVPGVARQQATTTTSANIVLTGGVARLSLFARQQPLRYLVGSALQTANASTSHYLAAGERIDMDLPANANIAVIRASDATGDGTAEITELT